MNQNLNLKLYKSVRLWDHRPTLEEINAAINKDNDIFLQYTDEFLLDKYLKIVGLKIFFTGNGRAGMDYCTEYKYVYNISENKYIFPDINENEVSEILR